MTDIPVTSGPSTPVPQAQELPSFKVSEFRPDGGFNLGGVLMLISALVLIGGVLGLATHYISKVFYLIILFPALIGAAMGAVGKRMVVSGRTRNALVGGVAGLLGGIFAMSITHWFDYEEFKTNIAKIRPEVRDAAFALAQMSPAERDEALGSDVSKDERASIGRLIKLVSVHNFLDYMNLEAHEGVVIQSTHSSSSDHGINLGFYGSYIYWIVEIIIVAAITFGMVKGATAEPFCVQCGKWKKLDLRGFFETRDIAAVGTAVRSVELSQLRAVGPTENVTNQRLTGFACQDCGATSEIDLKLEALSTDGKGNVVAKTAAFVRYPGEAYAFLKQLFVPPPPTSPQGDVTAAET